MDNEEIRKLLQELKESSDESSSVRSRIVKIHVDTPAEAEQRRKVKEREEAQEARRLAREKEKAEAEAEARRLEAEKAAQAAVEEAKAEAKAGFAADLDASIQADHSLLAQGEDSAEDDGVLDLNWNYEKPSLTSGFAKDEDFDLGGGSVKKDSESDGSAGEDEFDSDEADFRDEDEPGGSITGLPGRFGEISDRVLSFFGSIRSSVKEDLSKAAGRARPDGEPEAEAGEDSSDDDGRMPRGAADGPDDDVPAGDVPADDAPADDAPAQDEAPAREYGPDEEWKRRMEEPPVSKPRFQLPRLTFGRKSRKRKDDGDRAQAEETPEGRAQAEEAPESRAQAEETPEGSLKAEEVRVESLQDARNYDESPQDTETHDGPVPDDSAAEADPKHTGARGRNLKAAKVHDGPVPDDSAAEADPEHTGSRGRNPETAKAPDEILQNEEQETVFRSIELIDLNENQNNKDAEVIELVGDTGPLPDPAELKREGKKRRVREKKKDRPKESRKKRPARAKKAGSAGRFLSAHRKQLAAAAIAAAAVIVAVIAFVLISGQMNGIRHAVIEADEGLKVQVLEQPDSFTDEGDVQIRVKAPETIQSVTVNGENVVAPQGRSVDFTYHATGGTLDIMAVSTDQVRSAKVILAYVDAQPPVVTIREEKGSIVLSAEDTESGVDAVYIGTISGLSDIPQYEKYSEPLEMNPEKEISYYAQDIAGNATTPVTVALTPAESIAFDRESYGLFPGSVCRVNLITTPANAFVNNLTLEAENPKVVQVEGDMQIRGMAEGDTKITATADGIAGVMANVSVSSQRKVTISAIGDCTLGTDASFSQNDSFNAYQALYGNSYFFEKVRGILGSGDSTFANFEGTLTTSEDRRDKKFTFKGDPSYTEILKDGHVDVVSLANNHTHDFKEQGLADTKQALEAAGIEWCEGDHIAWRELNGVKCAFIGIYALENGLESMPVVESSIAEAKQKGADLIIVGFHWGVELVREIDEFERELAHAAVDAGANLVVGTHSHVLMGIEKYHGAHILYGIGNFCFGGSSNPTSYDTIIWQQTFNLTADGLESEDDISIIPCQVSGSTASNNYQPVPVSGDAAANIMQTIDSLSEEFGQTYSQYMVDGTLWTDSGTG